MLSRQPQQLLICSPSFGSHLDKRFPHATKLQKDSSFPLQLVTAGILLTLFKKTQEHCFTVYQATLELAVKVKRFFSLQWLGVDLNQASLRIYTSLSISYNEEERFTKWYDNYHLHTNEERHPHQKQESRQHLSGLYPVPPWGHHPSESQLHKDRGTPWHNGRQEPKPRTLRMEYLVPTFLRAVPEPPALVSTTHHMSFGAALRTPVQIKGVAT